MTMEPGKQNTTNSDLIVIGAGPAGCAAAIWGAQKGLRVTMLESHASNQDKPGESFHPGIFSIFKLLGIERDVDEANFLRYSGQFVSWGQVSEFQSFGGGVDGSWLGVHALRSKFESILINRAISLGVNVKRPCKAISLVFDQKRLVGVNTSVGTMIGKFIIDASGSRHWLSRQKKLSINYLSHQLIAYYGYVKPTPLETEMGAFLDADSSGWSWVARVSPNHFAWIHLPFNKSERIEKVPYRLMNCDILGPSKGANVTWRTVPETAGLGYFIAGDAAGVFDPLSSDGVLRALMTGIKASFLAYSVIINNEQETRVIDYYRSWCKDIFNNEANKLKILYKDLLHDDHDKIYPENTFRNNKINTKTEPI